MIANLITGLRDIRAGLAAGYLWLVAIWLLVYDDVPRNAKEATGLWHSVFELEGVASALGVGAVLSFGAYLLGTASQAALDPIVRGMSRLLIGGRIVDIGQPDYGFLQTKFGIRGASIPARSWHTLDLIALEAVTRIEAIARDNIHNAISRPYAWSDEMEADAQGMSLDELRRRQQSQDESDFERWFAALVEDLEVLDKGTVFRGLQGIIAPRLLDRLRWAYAAMLPGLAPEKGPQPELDKQLSIALALELSLIKNRLLTQDLDQYNLVDRIESEAELRFALIAPLAAILSVLVAAASPGWAIGFIAIAVLYYQAATYERRANSAIVDRLLIGDVIAPSIERLERYAKEGQPTRRGQADRPANLTVRLPPLSGFPDQNTSNRPTASE